MARPKTGQTPPISFRPPQRLREEFDEEVRASGRNRSDVLIEAMHDWLRKRRRENPSLERPQSSEEPTA